MAAPSLAPSWVSYIHPAIAAAGLVLAWVTMQRGLVLRDARVKKQPVPTGAVGKHLWLARPAVIVLVLSSGAGLLSAVFARGFKPMNTGHGWLAVTATAGFIGTGLIGTGLTRDRNKRRGLHVAFSLLGLGVGLIAALTGIELLP